ncbi:MULTISPECIES: S-layer homology domain-containing protein [unclassified Anoxybacillus]|uniref:S-layer homology domain-containing protein n=1 Tax=unclassified Anoxybacillus TaxID=2639704 RepID=UPI001EDB8F3A|nr:MULTISPECIES: S-layer homology domain-containing protein [unclassified Anoxybacillus]MCG3084087.1 S-layer homology domain-containing protein [Anoxybacillus sp. LAT27]MCG5026180.1 S-layer homology domain-containing protein [Anoxybacillus flavithermus]MCG6175839.1 S-layer homology domain-containing protein [Anoxybacillus sp. LAT_31]MCG6181249.1 S-layer homology domain-containing protein [Anoxybacillus sp. LAT_33]
MAYQPKSYRKFLAGTVSAAVVASAIAPVASAASFTDVAGSVHADDIATLVAKGYIKGYADGTFKPDQSLTRGEAAIIFSRILKDMGVTEKGAGFPDVPAEKAELAEAVAIVQAAGIMTGDEKGNFNPNANITREQMAKVLVEAFDLMKPADFVSNVTDLDKAASWAREYIQVLDATDVTLNTEFMPKQNVTRGQFASFVVRAMNVGVTAANITGVAFVDLNTLEVTFNGELKEVKKEDFAIEGVEIESVSIKAAAAAEAKTTVVVIKTKTALEEGKAYNVSYKGQTTDKAKVDVPVVTPKVESVSAINAAQLQVKFNKAVDKSTVVESDGTLVAGVVSVTKVDGTGSVTIDGTSLASLSEDGKTLTITVASGALNSMKYVVNVPANTVKATDGKYVEKYTSEVLTASDSTAPTVTKTETLNASTVRVYFSEPLSSAGNWTFKLADGSTAIVTTTPNLAKGYVDLAIDSSVAAGKEITATIIGATDYANNLINPNPVTVKFTKGQLDGVKPTVTSVTALGLNKFEVKFSEEVQGFDGSDISIDGGALNDISAGAPGTLEAGEAKVTQDATDKTKYTVELGTALSAGIHTVGIVANAVSDLSGEQNVAFSKVVEFKADTTAPKLVSSEVKKENGAEYLYLTFDESVTPGVVSSLTAKQVKDYVTTPGTIDLSGLTAVSGTDNKQYKVALNAVQFTPSGGSAASLSTGATYTVTLANFTDASGNALADTTVTFNRASDTDTNKPAIDTTYDNGESSPHVASNGIKVVDNDTIQVKFDRALDGATATNKFNYQVNGLTVESATLLPNNIVELKLAADTNALSGLRNVTISGVKSKDGVLMDTFTASEYFVENVKPYVTSATLITPNQIKVVFSEAVQVSTVTAEDLDVYVGSTQEAETAPFAVTQANSGSTDKEFIITLTDDLTPAEYAQTITVKVVNGTTDIIVDANNNKVKTGVVTVSK